MHIHRVCALEADKLDVAAIGAHGPDAPQLTSLILLARLHMH